MTVTEMTPAERFARTGRWAKPGMWCNGDAPEVQIVTTGGGTSHGAVVRWTGPAECVLDNGQAGVLAETYERRQAQIKP